VEAKPLAGIEGNVVSIGTTVHVYKNAPAEPKRRPPYNAVDGKWGLLVVTHAPGTISGILCSTLAFGSEGITCGDGIGRLSRHWLLTEPKQRILERGRLETGRSTICSRPNGTLRIVCLRFHRCTSCMEEDRGNDHRNRANPTSLTMRKAASGDRSF